MGVRCVCPALRVWRYECPAAATREGGHRGRGVSQALLRPWAPGLRAGRPYLVATEAQGASLGTGEHACGGSVGTWALISLACARRWGCWVEGPRGRAFPGATCFSPCACAARAGGSSPAPPPQGPAGKGAWASSSGTAHAPWSHGHAVNAPPNPISLQPPSWTRGTCRGCSRRRRPVSPASAPAVSARPGPSVPFGAAGTRGEGRAVPMASARLDRPAAQAGSRDGAEAGQRPVFPPAPLGAPHVPGSCSRCPSPCRPV